MDHGFDMGKEKKKKETKKGKKDDDLIVLEFNTDEGVFKEKKSDSPKINGAKVKKNKQNSKSKTRMSAKRKSAAKRKQKRPFMISSDDSLENHSNEDNMFMMDDMKDSDEMEFLGGGDRGLGMGPAPFDFVDRLDDMFGFDTGFDLSSGVDSDEIMELHEPGKTEKKMHKRKGNSKQKKKKDQQIVERKGKVQEREKLNDKHESKMQPALNAHGNDNAENEKEKLNDKHELPSVSLTKDDKTSDKTSDKKIGDWFNNAFDTVKGWFQF